MKYETLLLDADGTLLDFKKSEEIGLKQVFEEFQISDQEACRTYYLALNERLWNGFEQGLYPKQHIFDVRFAEMLAHFEIKRDGAAMERSYRAWLDRGSHLIPHALQMVRELAKSCSLYIITNGVSKTQYRRLHDSGLDVYMNGIFVSEDIGYQKPQREYFDHVLQHIDKAKDKILVVGDSLHSDILGAQTAGLASCWFQADACFETSNIQADYQISDLRELWNIVK